MKSKGQMKHLKSVQAEHCTWRCIGSIRFKEAYNDRSSGPFIADILVFPVSFQVENWPESVCDRLVSSFVTLGGHARLWHHSVMQNKYPILN